MSASTSRCLVVVLLLAVGCGQQHDEVPATPSNATDIAYVQLAIPQDESVLPLLALARTRAAPDLVRLAERVDAGHRAELTRLRAYLSSVGVVDDHPHEGHDMPGMVTEAEVAGAALAQGDAFDESVRRLLRAHFEESTTVARAELKGGSVREVLDLASEVERSRTDYLSVG
jgi:uncharacterized protein (DUF305 family)